MASSSLSAESLDHDDFSLTNRRSRIKVLRSRASVPAYHTTESIETPEDDLDAEPQYFTGGGSHLGGDPVYGGGYPASPGHVVFGTPTIVGSGCVAGSVDRDSPTRVRGKDKGGPGGARGAVWTGGHLHKAKLPAAAKDKRKLREKRRSCGLVHMQSTEVTRNRLYYNTHRFQSLQLLLDQLNLTEIKEYLRHLDYYVKC